MPDTSPKLELALPKQIDPFLTSEIRANWETIDACPGDYICTSSTRPTWKGAQAGRKIQETNTGLQWRWTGTAWARTGPTGLLKKSNGDWAIAERFTPFSTTSKTYVKATSVTGVVVPDGNRPLRIDVNWVSLKNTAKPFYLAVYRSDTSASGPFLSHWTSGTQGDVDNAGGGSYFVIERNGLAAGTYSWSLQIHSDATAGGTSTLGADDGTPISIFVTEM